MLGAVAPDLPVICAVAVLRARGRPTEGLLDAAYHGPGLAPLHMAVHSLLAPTAAALVGRAPRAFAAGWLGHLLVDYATHARDAWPPAWPLSRRRFPSPVSYWEPDRHARAFSAIEVAALVAAASRDRGLPARRDWRRRRSPRRLRWHPRARACGMPSVRDRTSRAAAETSGRSASRSAPGASRRRRARG